MMRQVGGHEDYLIRGRAAGRHCGCGDGSARRSSVALHWYKELSKPRDSGSPDDADIAKEKANLRDDAKKAALDLKAKYGQQCAKVFAEEEKRAP
jgi:hypothetical protein